MEVYRKQQESLHEHSEVSNVFNDLQEYTSMFANVSLLYILYKLADLWNFMNVPVLALTSAVSGVKQ